MAVWAAIVHRVGSTGGGPPRMLLDALLLSNNVRQRTSKAPLSHGESPMSWLAKQMRWLMLVSGILTSTMVYAAIVPRAALQANFGSTLEGPVAEIVVRNWGALIALIGLMLIYGALVPPARRLVLSVAVISKLTFIGLVLTYGRALLAHQVGVAVAVDAVWVLVFTTFLLGTGHHDH